MKRLKVTASFTLNTVWRLWNEINAVCFDGDLHPPLRILIEDDLDHLFDRRPPGQTGHVVGYCDQDPVTKKEVLLFRSDLQSYELPSVVAHEMVHQHLAQLHGYRRMCDMWHGPAFDAYAPQIKLYYNTKLTGSEY